MGKINVLDMEVANKIAAGEVVERPASVVKELVENSIDAKSSIITIEIENGGITLLRITDNGFGMSAEDAQTAFLRHATSKIRTDLDLLAISSLGFRGEALSSIAAVSRVTLFTREKGVDTGFSLKIADGQIIEKGVVGCPEGTVLEIRDIFYNTPARRKFLKSERTEAGYIAEIIEKITLSYPHIAFKFISDGRVRLQTYGDGDLKTAIYNIYGKEFSHSVREVNLEAAEISVGGFAGLPILSRGNRRMQNFYVNGRFVKSPMLTAAAEEAYKNRVMIGRFPFFVLSISLPAENVDVNVHPAKTEVKFADEKAVYSAVYSAVTIAITEGGPVSVSAPVKVAPQTAKAPELVPISGHTEIKKIEKPQFEMKSQAETENIIKEIHNVFMDKPLVEKPVMENIAQEKPKLQYEEQIITIDRMPVPHTNLDATITLSSPAQPDIYGKTQVEKEKEEETEYRIIGQLFDTYILIERGGGFVLIDQHAAHERQKYEELKTLKTGSQIMLIPAIIKLTPVEFRAVMDNLDMFEEIGFELDDFGNNSIAVRQTPVALESSLIQDIIEEITENIITGKKQIRAEVQDRALYTIACKSAIKANRNISHDEMKAIADWVFSVKGVNTCPHGRPVSIELTKYEIEKMFGRV
ncbi:MAG: DNA mismatch repair endonuclease MutL [Eubacteriales bacterium]|nr:DNA mismatch repair endonuclease MutL [Eubacteriales bacterium]